MAQIAYILHKRDYRETSSIIDVLTRDLGRVSLLVRGVRGGRSKAGLARAGSLMLFTPLVLSWRGRGSLPTVSSIERADLKAPELKPKALLCAMYINELLTYLLHRDDAQEAVFELYHHCLYELQDESQLEICLRRFEIRLLVALGFAPGFEQEADTGKPIVPDSRYLYHPERGPVKTDALAVAGAASLPLPCISGHCLLALARQQYSQLAGQQELMVEAKRLMRCIIHHHLGGRQLKSRELFQPVSGTAGAAAGE